MSAELKALRFEFCFRLEHSISSFLRPARFGNDNDERLREVIVDPVDDAIEAIRISVIKKIDVHLVAR